MTQRSKNSSNDEIVDGLLKNPNNDEIVDGLLKNPNNDEIVGALLKRPMIVNPQLTPQAVPYSGVKISRLLETAASDNFIVELIELGMGWGDWNYQLNIYAVDGRAYGRPGQKTRISMGNFLREDDARVHYEDAKGYL